MHFPPARPTQASRTQYDSCELYNTQTLPLGLAPLRESTCTPRSCKRRVRVRDYVQNKCKQSALVVSIGSCVPHVFREGVAVVREISPYTAGKWTSFGSGRGIDYIPLFGAGFLNKYKTVLLHIQYKISVS